MFKTILVPTDGSPLTDTAINLAIEFAKTNRDSQIIGLAVAEPYPFSPLSESAMSDSGLYEQKMREIAQRNVEIIETAAKRENVHCQTIVTQSFSPSDEIIGIAKKHHCDVIFMATHQRRGIKKIFMGSETEKVLAQVGIPVLVLR